jgi:cobalt-zinc-cadmium efflux system membrane fusion protein
MARGAALLASLAVTALIAYTLGRDRAAPPVAAPASAPAAAPTTRSETVTLSERALEEAGLAIEAARQLQRADALEGAAVLALDETRTARVGSIVEGTVLKTLVEVGARVRQGTLLAQLQSHVVHDAWADYRRAIAERRRLQTELTYAREAERRAERLLADKAISLQERERAAANRVAAEEQLDMAGTEVRRSEEALEHLGVTNKEDPSGETGEQIPALSPLAGVVLERMVTPGSAVVPGAPLFVVSDLGALWALAEVDERHLAALSVGRPMTVQVAAYADERFPGTVAFIGDTVDSKTRRVVVRCSVPNPGGRLKPGMFATVRLETSAPRRLVAVPAAAVQDVDGRKVVFVERTASTFAVRPVTLGQEADAWVEVLTGVAAGERVVAAGSFLLKSELLKSATPDEG